MRKRPVKRIISGETSRYRNCPPATRAAAGRSPGISSGTSLAKDYARPKTAANVLILYRYLSYKSAILVVRKKSSRNSL